MASNKKEIQLLGKRLDHLETQFKELNTLSPDYVNQRFKSIEEMLYTNKDILNMKEVSQYLNISQSLLYKLTCNGEIPHFKPRGKMIFFEKKEIVEWIKKNRFCTPQDTSVHITKETDNPNSPQHP